jgi:hypothetical protein
VLDHDKGHTGVCWKSRQSVQRADAARRGANAHHRKRQACTVDKIKRGSACCSGGDWVAPVALTRIHYVPLCTAARTSIKCHSAAAGGALRVLTNHVLQLGAVDLLAPKSYSPAELKSKPACSQKR